MNAPAVEQLPERQVLRGLPLAWYHNSPNISHSKLRAFGERGPAYFHACYLTGDIQREVTDALVFGQACEILVQEGGNAFRERVGVLPAGDGRNSAVKAAKAALSRSKLVVKQDDYHAMLEMAATVRDDGLAQALIEGAEQQVTLIAPRHGLTMQARPDWIHFEGCPASDYRPYTLDFKTTKELADLESGRGVWQHGYHTQAALCRQLCEEHGLSDTRHYLLAVEKQPMYRSAVIELHPDALEYGDRWVNKQALALAECLRENRWPRSRREVVVLRRPHWAKDGE